jgi:hypothetical protein
MSNFALKSCDYAPKFFKRCLIDALFEPIFEI